MIIILNSNLPKACLASSKSDSSTNLKWIVVKNMQFPNYYLLQ